MKRRVFWSALLSICATSCSLSLRVSRSTTTDVVRESLGPHVAVSTERRGANVEIAVVQAERVRKTTYEVARTERRRAVFKKSVNRPGLVLLDVLPVLPLVDLVRGAGAPFQQEFDVAYGGL